MRILLTIILLIAAFAIGTSQPSFIVNISNELDDWPSHIIEDIPGQYILAGFRDHMGSTESCKSFIYQISQSGDTISKNYILQDTVLQFHKIAKINSGNYMIFGSCAFPPNYSQCFLVAILNSDLEILKLNVIDFQIFNNSVIRSTNFQKLDTSFIVVSTFMDNIYNYQQTVLVKVNNQGDTISTELIDDSVCGNGLAMDVEISPQEDEIWILGNGYSSSDQLSRLIFDTDFSFKRSHFISSQMGLNVNAKRLSDSSFIYSSCYTYLGSNPQDDDLCIAVTDSSFVDMDLHFLGTPDTLDYPGWGQFIDFNHSDSIYYTGTHNIIIDFWPIDSSWIMFGQLDENLNERFRYYYGGDAYYKAMDVVATSDGGCLISALKYDHLLQNHEKDIVILKYSRNDLITNTYDLTIEDPGIQVFPNPGSNVLNVNLQSESAQFMLYAIDGKAVVGKQLYSGMNNINVTQIPPGIYIYSISKDGAIIERNKWIKN